MMNRREAIGRVALTMGGAILGTNTFLGGCSARKTQEAVPSEITRFLDAVGETILPASAASPGAKETEIGKFMQTIVEDCYQEKDQKIFYEGIEKLNAASQAKYENVFLDLSPGERLRLLVEIDREATLFNKTLQEGDPEHYFSMMKQLTLWGYFTSEPGATKALRYVPVPGKYEGCIPYRKGDKAFSAI